jgi:hypothetical protein
MSPAKTIRKLEKRGKILWEQPRQVDGKWRTKGWAICPCCNKRELEIDAPGEWPNP